MADFTIKASNHAQEDRRAYAYHVKRENDSRAQRNIAIQQENIVKVANGQTPTTLLTILPDTTPVDRANSYELLLVERVQGIHQSMMREQQEASKNDVSNKDIIALLADATPAKKAAALAALQ